MEVIYYKTAKGNSPFIDWLKKLKDKQAVKQIRKRVNRLQLGHLGDVESIGDSILELRVHHGPGYRLYCTKVDETIMIMLCAGNKSSQQRDIDKAKEYWNDYNS